LNYIIYQINISLTMPFDKYIITCIVPNRFGFNFYLSNLQVLIF